MTNRVQFDYYEGSDGKVHFVLRGYGNTLCGHLCSDALPPMTKAPSYAEFCPVCAKLAAAWREAVK